MNKIDEIISNVHSYKKLLHTSFREIYLLFDNYWIQVNPFAYQVYNYPKANYFDGKSVTYCHPASYFVLKNNSGGNFHHQDFIRNEIKYDPCNIYEEISGLKTPTMNEEKYDINNPDECAKWDDIFKRDTKFFKDYCLKRERQKKFKRILINSLD
jgi:hypothetical protein